MNNKKTVMAVFGLVMLAGCTQGSVDLDAERAALRAAADAYHAMGSSSDSDGVTAMYASDGLILPPNADAIQGTQGVREFASAFTQLPGFSMSFGDVIADVGSGGDLGYTLVDTIITVDGPDGEPVEDRVRDFHLWTKQGGEWKVAIDIWNSELPTPGASASSPLEGAWIVTSWSDADGNVLDEPQPAIYVFTPTHYSIMIAQGTEPRATYEGDDMTDAQILEAYGTIVANAGRYEVDGNTLKTRAYVAKDPNYMGGWPENEVTYEFERDGDTLTIKNLVFDSGATGTFRQVEGTPNPW
jgi:ketosteroid isomerase-like protein